MSAKRNRVNRPATKKSEWPEKRDYDRSRRFAPSSTEDVSMGLISLTSEPPAPAGNKAAAPRRRQ